MSRRPPSTALALALLLGAAGAAPGQIIHRYTFNGNGNDSVGTANATLVNAATNGAQVVLDNGANVASNTATGKYVSLPSSAFPTGPGGLTSFSIEVFYNWVGQPGQTWDRLFDFNNGTDTTVTPPRQYLFLTPRSGAQPTNVLRYAITQNDPGNEFQVNGTDQSPFGAPAFAALTYDAASTTGTLYVGTGTTLTQVGQNFTTALDPSQLAGITNLWIGRSAFNGDPLFNGSIDQFDIFSAARTPAQVQADFLAGPVAPVPEPSALALTGAAALGLAVWRRRTVRRAPVQSPG
jgi:hypothetical protein